MSDEYTRHELKLGWACYTSYRRKDVRERREDWYEFDKKEYFNAWLLSKAKKKRKLYVFGSNVWFDMRVTDVDKYLLSHGYKNTRLYDAGLVTIIGFKKGSSVIMFLAIQNLLRCSVAQLGKWMGYKKGVIDFENTTIEKLREYCRRDVEIIKRAFTEWRDFCLAHQLGVFGPTISSQAFNGYRHRFMPRDIFIHDSSRTIRLERDGYFGGRTECFRLGSLTGTRFYKLDVNSLYPAVMRGNRYPVKLKWHKARISVDYLRRLIQQYMLTARVLVDISEPYIAKKIDNRTCFPIGRFETVVSTPALKRLLERNELIKVLECAVYEGGEIFTEYVDFFNGLKEECDRADDKMGRNTAKYFMNCLYGKFGQRKSECVKEEERDLDEMDTYSTRDLDSGERYWVVVYGGKMRMYKKGEKNGFNSFVAIASHVTEYARLLLWDSIVTAGRENVFYCDTDSIFVNEKGYRNTSSMLHKTRLGYWKMEDSSDTLLIRTCKDYTFGEETKRKGIRKDAVLTPEGKWKQDMFPSFRTYLRGPNIGGYYVKTIEKTLTGRYTKGLVGIDGRVEPFTLKE